MIEVKQFRDMLISAFARLDPESPELQAFRAAYDYRLGETDPIEVAGGLPTAIERALMLHMPNPTALPDLDRVETDSSFVRDVVLAAERVPNSAYHHMVLWLERFALMPASDGEADTIVKTSLLEYARYAKHSLSP